jgi:diadenosine tetraphosphate (Ap4A) HIT family hydrolase
MRLEIKRVEDMNFYNGHLSDILDKYQTFIGHIMFIIKRGLGII